MILVSLVVKVFIFVCGLMKNWVIFLIFKFWLIFIVLNLIILWNLGFKFVVLILNDIYE